MIDSAPSFDSRKFSSTDDMGASRPEQLLWHYLSVVNCCARCGHSTEEAKSRFLFAASRYSRAREEEEERNSGNATG